MGHEVVINVWTLIAACGIPSAVTGFGFWAVKRIVDKAEKARIEREKTREDYQIMIFNGTCASLSLGISNAEEIGVDSKNHNRESIVDKAKKIKTAQDAFVQKMQEQGVKNLL